MIYQYCNFEWDYIEEFQEIVHFIHRTFDKVKNHHIIRMRGY
jgi:hypothetical protein